MSLHREFLTTNLFINIKNIYFGLKDLKTLNSLHMGHGALDLLWSLVSGLS